MESCSCISIRGYDLSLFKAYIMTLQFIQNKLLWNKLLSNEIKYRILTVFPNCLNKTWFFKTNSLSDIWFIFRISMNRCSCADIITFLWLWWVCTTLALGLIFSLNHKRMTHLLWNHLDQLIHTKNQHLK